MVEVVINLVTSLLLLVTTTWCILVYGRLRRFRIERDELEACVAALDRASDRAEAVLATWRAECSGFDQVTTSEPAVPRHDNGSRLGKPAPGANRGPPPRPVASVIGRPDGGTTEGSAHDAAPREGHPSPRSRPMRLGDVAAAAGDGGRPSFADMDKLR